MKINIIGDGSFGKFLKELLPVHGFNITNDAYSVILAVPISAYESVAHELCFTKKMHLINVCSVQESSTNILLRHTSEVTSIHPLFGKRTPELKRNSILTYECGYDSEKEFIDKFGKVSNIFDNNQMMDKTWERFTPESHDKLMARTHLKAVHAAQLIKPFVTDTTDIPDELIPNSFRLLRDFVKTLDDMPRGTLESILANPYE